MEKNASAKRQIDGLNFDLDIEGGRGVQRDIAGFRITR